MFEARRYRMKKLSGDRCLRVCEYTFGSTRCHCGRNNHDHGWKHETTALRQWSKKKLSFPFASPERLRGGRGRMQAFDPISAWRFHRQRIRISSAEGKQHKRLSAGGMAE